MLGSSLKSKILCSEIHAVHVENKTLWDVIQCSHYTDLWDQLKCAAASSQACGNRREKDEFLSEMPWWCLHEIHPSKVFPEAPPWRQHWNGGSIWTQNGSTVRLFLTQNFRPLPHWDHDTNQAGGKVPSWIWPFCFLPFMQTVLKRLTEWEKEVVQGPRSHRLAVGSLGDKSCSSLTGYALYTKFLLDKTKVQRAFRGGQEEGDMLKNVHVVWWTEVSLAWL